jgi:hypothetical protein
MADDKYRILKDILKVAYGNTLAGNTLMFPFGKSWMSEALTLNKQFMLTFDLLKNNGTTLFFYIRHFLIVLSFLLLPIFYGIDSYLMY